MENNFKYFNAFFIIVILALLLGLFKYFLYEEQENDSFYTVYKKKYIYKNYIDHILFIPDNYYFLKMKKLDGFNYEYILLMKKFFNIITESLKYPIPIITINFINVNDLSSMNDQDIQNLIDNTKLWKLIEKYAKKMNLKINFIYNKFTLNKNFITILKDLETKINSHKYIAEVNFLIGYDLFDDIKNIFINLIQNNKNKEDLLSLNKYDIENILLNNLKPIDLVITFNHASINDSLLLHMRNSKIINLNYSLEKITPNMIYLLIKDLVINVHPFF